MIDQSGSSRLRVLFEAALQDFEKQTGIVLAEHPLAEQLQNCDSVDSVTALLCEQTEAFKESRGKDKVMKPLKNAASVLYKLSSVAGFGQDVGLHLPPVKAIQTGLAVLLSTVKDVIDDYDALANLLESIEYFLNRLEIYIEIPPAVAMNEMIVKILIELLSTLALATKQTKEGKLKKLVKKLLGETKIKAMVQRLDRLTQEEARMTTTHVLEVVHGLVQNMNVVMDDGKVSVDHLKDTLKIVHQLASERNKANRDKLQQDILRWLSSPEPWKNYYLACESRHPGSATWFVQSDVYSKWKVFESRSPLLWVKGKPGAGKSVLCSTIIEDIEDTQKAGLASLAFFYCDFREDQKRDLRGLLSSLLVQLCHQSDSYYNLLSKFYSEHAHGLRPPSDGALTKCLKDLLKLPNQPPVYIVVDALDECPNTPTLRSPRAKVLDLIKELIESHLPNLRLCVTSRLETDIKDVLDHVLHDCVSLHDENGQKRDIEDYIKFVINEHKKNKNWTAEDKQLTIEVLIEKADGMFRWVDCQVDYICGCIPASIRQALADLPETLDGTYQRTLREIKKADWEHAHRLFQFVSVASRPLRVQELAELLAFDFKAGPVPKFHEDWRLQDPVDAVLSTCSSLLVVVNVEGVPVIQFSHFSVREFLTSTRLAEAGASDIYPRHYHISMTTAHTLAAQVCLGILLHLEKGVITDDSLEKFPLAEYAAEHWVHHAQLGNESRNMQDGMKQLFDPRRPHLAVCVWICDPCLRPSERKLRAKRPLTSPGTALHYAIIWGLHFIVEFLIIERSHDVNPRGFSANATPLHLASERGQVKTALILIEHGADATAQNKDGETPLHMALCRGKVGVARMLIERGPSVSAQNKDGETPLHLALRLGQLGVARMLIERSPDMSAQNKNGETPLHLALRRRQVEVARMLIDRNPVISAQNKDGETPLHLALFGGQVDVARMLIERSSDVSARNKDGETPLHLALRRGQMEVARMLIRHGADVAAQDMDEETPLHLVSREGQVEIGRMLIKRGADLTAQNKDGETLLHLALRWGQVEFARMLIERDVNVMARNKSGWTPLHLALFWGRVDIAHMLIEHGADVESRNNDGDTPLLLALTPSYWTQKSSRQYAEVTRILLEHGADANAQNKYGLTPFRLASQGELADVVNVLLGHGADPVTHNDMD